MPRSGRFFRGGPGGFGRPAARLVKPVREARCYALLGWGLGRNVAGYEFAVVGTFVLDAGHGADTDAAGDASVVVDGELHGVRFVLVGDFERDGFLIGSDRGDLAGNFVGLRVGLLSPMPCCRNMMRGRGSSEKQECCESGAREKFAKRWFAKTLSLPLGSASWRSSDSCNVGGANWAGAEAWADAGPIARKVWRRADGRRVVKGNVLGGGLVRAWRSTSAGRGRNYCTGAVFSFRGCRWNDDGLGGLGACGAQARGGRRGNGLGLGFGRFRFLEIEIPTLRNDRERWGRKNRLRKSQKRRRDAGGTKGNGKGNDAGRRPAVRTATAVRGKKQRR